MSSGHHDATPFQRFPILLPRHPAASPANDGQVSRAGPLRVRVLSRARDEGATEADADRTLMKGK